MVPALSRYRFTRTEACLMWAHVECGIELFVVGANQAGDRVDVVIKVWHGCDPFGDHQEWAWRETLTLRGAVRAGPSAGEAQIVPDDPSIVASLTFDPAKPEVDTVWGIDDARSDRVTPPHDFWGWAQQVPAWSRPLAQADLDEVAGTKHELPRVADFSTDWGARQLQDTIRVWDDRRVSVKRGLGYPLEPGAHAEKRAASNRRWVIVFVAYEPARVAALLAAGPPAGATPEQRDNWYRHVAGRRPEYALGWLADIAEADRWVAHLDQCMLSP
jgi:hypothetical protein